MRPPPEDFHHRVRVRLPFADRYALGGEVQKSVEKELARAFTRPIIRIDIPSGSERTPHTK